MLTPKLEVPTGRWWGRILWKGGAESTQNRSVSYVKASTCRRGLCGYAIFHEHAVGFLVHNANNYSGVGSRGSGVEAKEGSRGYTVSRFRGFAIATLASS